MKRLFKAWRLAQFLLAHPALLAQLEIFIQDDSESARLAVDNKVYIETLRQRVQQQENYDLVRLEAARQRTDEVSELRRLFNQYLKETKDGNCS